MKRELLLLFMHMFMIQITCYDHRYKNYDDTPSYPIAPIERPKKMVSYSTLTVPPSHDKHADKYDHGYDKGYKAGQKAAEHTFIVDVYTTVSDPDCTTTQVVEVPVTSTTTTVPIATTTIDIPYSYFTTTLPFGLLTITIPVRTKVVTIPVFTTTITRRYITA